LHRDLRSGVVDLAEIIGRKVDRRGSDIVFEAMQLGRTWNWHDPRPLRKQPSKDDLRRCRLLLFGDLAKQWCTNCSSDKRRHEEMPRCYIAVL
jgi:hypothetical protein